jgi:hypothetical protein
MKPFAAATFFIAASTLVLAQGQPSRLYVFAVDSSGAPVGDLTAPDLELRENGSVVQLLSLRRGTDPIRLVIINNVGDATEIDAVKRGLKEMIAAVPASTEVALATATGGYSSQLAPTPDRQRQLSAIAALREGGGELAHALMESDTKLFRGQPARWPIYVIVTDDFGENTSGVKQIEFDAFSDRLAHSATVHAVLSKQGTNSQTGKIIDALARHLTDNTGGLYQEVSSGRGLADAIAGVGTRIAIDAQRMSDGYELSYEGSASGSDRDLQVGISRQGVALHLSFKRVP